VRFAIIPAVRSFASIVETNGNAGTGATPSSAAGLRAIFYKIPLEVATVFIGADPTDRFLFAG
jgi:hypothetical protein